MAVGGESVDLLHAPREKEDVKIVLRLPRGQSHVAGRVAGVALRSGDANALAEPDISGNAPLVPLRELVRVEQTNTDKSIYHKNLMPVTYVIGDVAGVVESPVYAILKMNNALQQLDTVRRSAVTAGSAGDLQCHLPFTEARAGDEVGRRMAHYDRGLSRFGIRLRGRAGADLSADGGLVSLLPHAADRNGCHSIFAHRDIAGAQRTGRIFHRHVDDRIHGRRRASSFAIPSSWWTSSSSACAKACRSNQAVVDAGAVRFRPMLLTALAVVVGSSGDSLRSDLSGIGHLTHGRRDGVAC